LTDLQGRILSGERELGQAELLDRAARAATGFAAIGVGNEDAVAIMLRNDFPFFEASMAANMLGAHPVPLNWHFREEEGGYILRDCAARVLVIHADLLPQIEAGIPRGVEVLVAETPPDIRSAYGIAEDASRPPEAARSWSDWVSDQEPRELMTSPHPPSSMIYTSGTTGNPKGVRRNPFTVESAARYTAMVKAIFGFSEEGDFRTAVTGPMYHAAPNAYGLYAARNGGFCILQPRFDPEGLLALIQEHRLTHLHMVPTMFVRLLKLPEGVRARYDLSSLEFVVHAAAPCPPDIKRRMIEWWGPVINEYYGATETGGVVVHTAEEALRKPGTVGRPVPGGHVRIYDDDGHVLGPREIGDVYLKIDDFPDFTYNGLDEKRQEIERDGMVTAGDVGYLDEDGYLFLCDRKKDMVISGGVNIYPAEIEGVLIDMPGVKDCAVFGIPDEEFGEALCAYIEPEPGAKPSDGEVRTYLLSRLARYKVPRVVELIGELPREDSGKIFKRKLRAPYWERAGRQI
jgi:long-chain acyl-CoA synthetase